MSAAYLTAAALLGLVFASSPPPELAGRVAELEEGMVLYRLGFVGATFLAPTLVGVLVLLMAAAAIPAASPHRWVASILLAAYVPFATISYTSQYLLLPGLLQGDPQVAGLWYLHDPRSIPYALDLTGYAVLGLALVVLAPALRRSGGAYRWISALLLAVAGFSLTAFGAHAAGVTTFASACSATSAAFTLPVMGLAIRQGFALRRRDRGRSDAPTGSDVDVGVPHLPTSAGVTDPEHRSTRLELYWIPLGAGARTVRVCGKAYEALHAAVRRRPRAPLYHSALIATTEAGRYVIEMAPTVDKLGQERRGVVVQGPVGSAVLRRLRLFRYEVRRWRDGAIPDIEHATGSPVLLTDDPASIDRVLDLVPSVPAFVWGRDEAHAGDMWNSNSVIAWLLARCNLLAAAGAPPEAGRAPGWSAGIHVGSNTGGEPVAVASP